MPGINQLSDFKLKIGYWITTHKIVLKRLSLFLLFLLDVFLITFSLYGLVQFYTTGRDKFESSIARIGLYDIDFNSYHNQNFPKNIRLIEMDTVNIGKNKYNFIAKIQNPNKEDWLIEEINYYFRFGDSMTDIKKAFILPGEEKYLVDFNVNTEGVVSDVELRISSIKWNRIRKGEVNDLKREISNFTDFEITNEKFLSSITLGTGGDNPASSIQFTVKNNTIYDFYDVGFYVVTYSGPDITSSNYVVLSDVFSDEVRDIDVRWHNNIATPSQIVIIPEVDFLDKTVIMSKYGVGFLK